MKTEILDYLKDYHDGKIQEGLDTGIVPLDVHIRFKHGQLNIINGLDNVGKTVWVIWYMLCLSVKHDLKWCIWSGENNPGQLTRQLIQFKSGIYVKDMKWEDIMRHEAEISKWFSFVPNNKFYKSKELFAEFLGSDCDGALIDPYTGLDRKYTHDANYDFLNEAREFSQVSGITLYVNTHVVSEAARRTYSDSHSLAGYPFPPSKSQSEGGQPFANRCDDFITIHRLLGHPLHHYTTHIYVRKIKDTETGGKVTDIEDPVAFDYNKGLGFTCGGHNVLNNINNDDLGLNDLTPNDDFWNE